MPADEEAKFQDWFMTKSFDAVEMMRRFREAVGKDVESKTSEEQCRYIEERVQPRRFEKREHEDQRKAV